MFLGQSICVGGFVVLRVCQLKIHLDHAMDIVWRYMYSVVGVYFDGGM